MHVFKVKKTLKNIFKRLKKVKMWQKLKKSFKTVFTSMGCSAFCLSISLDFFLYDFFLLSSYEPVRTEGQRDG